MFSKPFKLSHSCTTGSVFFIGYTTVVEETDGGMGGYDDSDSDSDDDRQAQALMHRVKENGQREARLAKPELMKDGAKQVKPEPVIIDKAADISGNSYEMKSKDLGRNGCSKCQSPLTRVSKDSIVAERSFTHIETQLLALHSAEENSLVAFPLRYYVWHILLWLQIGKNG